jgi:starch synthase
MKRKNTAALCGSVGLPYDPAVPVFGMISRLADQKGFDLLRDALDELMRLPLQLVILGTGEQKYHEMLQAAHRAHPDRIAVRLAFDNALAHLIEAGSDLFLMPSRYEPCGLNQIYSLRYGTVPVVRATGGLDDTIVDVSADPARGTGFKFSEHSGAALLDAVRRSLPLFRRPDVWRTLMKRGMAEDFSWTASARRYADLYRSLASA